MVGLIRAHNLNTQNSGLFYVMGLHALQYFENASHAPRIALRAFDHVLLFFVDSKNKKHTQKLFPFITVITPTRESLAQYISQRERPGDNCSTQRVDFR